MTHKRSDRPTVCCVRHLSTHVLRLLMFRIVVLSLCLSGHLPPLAAQDTPLLSGGVGFFSNTNGGNTSYFPILAPLLAAPLGNSLLVESRATLAETFSPGPSGYTTSHFAGLSFLQLDYLATPHITIVAGYFLTPFGTYNERLTPIWIGNFQDAPLIFPIGTGDGSSSGFMMRGSAVSTANFSVDYAAYFSANSTNPQFKSTRASGGRVEIYFPKQGLEIGTSYARALTQVPSNSYGMDLWWEPIGTPFRFRSEYAHSAHADGYWIEADYRLSAWGGGPDTLIGRIEPVFRWQQFFRNSPDPTDGLPPVNTNEVQVGLNYRLPHDVRILTSYGRQFTPVGDVNIWQTGIVYRFLFPAWKGGS
jgi:hypothetical protein